MEAAQSALCSLASPPKKLDPDHYARWVRRTVAAYVAGNWQDLARFAKHPDIDGTCRRCHINLWKGKPALMPCNLEGCPYEDRAHQDRRTDVELLLRSQAKAP